MNKKLSVMTILGTRPEIIRLSRIISALDKNTNHTLVHTAQNYAYELNKVFFDDLTMKKAILVVNKSDLGIDAISDEITNHNPIFVSVKQEKNWDGNMSPLKFQKLY